MKHPGLTRWCAGIQSRFGGAITAAMFLKEFVNTEKAGPPAAIPTVHTLSGCMPVAGPAEAILSFAGLCQCAVGKPSIPASKVNQVQCHPGTCDLTTGGSADACHRCSLLRGPFVAPGSPATKHACMSAQSPHTPLSLHLSAGRVGAPGHCRHCLGRRQSGNWLWSTHAGRVVHRPGRQQQVKPAVLVQQNCVRLKPDKLVEPMYDA